MSNIHDIYPAFVLSIMCYGSSNDAVLTNSLPQRVLDIILADNGLPFLIDGGLLLQLCPNFRPLFFLNRWLNRRRTWLMGVFIQFYT